LIWHFLKKRMFSHFRKTGFQKFSSLILLIPFVNRKSRGYSHRMWGCWFNSLMIFQKIWCIDWFGSNSLHLWILFYRMMCRRGTAQTTKNRRNSNGTQNIHCLSRENSGFNSCRHWLQCLIPYLKLQTLTKSHWFTHSWKNQ